MKKDYTKWFQKKDLIENEVRPQVYFHEREVWWCSMGANIGFEQDGKGNDFVRPILIMKVFNKQVFVSLPLTTKNKEGKYYMPVLLHDGVERKVILSQIKLIDAKRLQEKIGVIDIETFKKIKRAMIQLLE